MAHTELSILFLLKKMVYDLIKAKWLIMKHEKDKKKLFCKNVMCPCNNAGGDDGTAPLEYYYCLSGFCEYPSAWMEVELNELNSK